MRFFHSDILFRQEFIGLYGRFHPHIDVFNNKGEPHLDFYQRGRLMETLNVTGMHESHIHDELVKRGLPYHENLPKRPLRPKWNPRVLEAEGEDQTYDYDYPVK